MSTRPKTKQKTRGSFDRSLDARMDGETDGDERRETLRQCPMETVRPDWAIFWTLCNFLKPLATVSLSKSPTFLGHDSF